MRRKTFSKQTSIDLFLNYILHMSVMLTIMKVFILLILLCLWEQGTPQQFSKQISKLFFQLSFHIYSSLAQETFESSVKNFSLCQFWNNKLIPLQILYPSSVSWKTTPLYFFLAQTIYSLLKRSALQSNLCITTTWWRSFCNRYGQVVIIKMTCE